MLKLLEARLLFLFLCLIFRIVLDLNYAFFLHPLFSYSGFHYDFFLHKYLISWILYFLCLLITPHLLVRVSDYFVASFLLTIIGPLSSLFGFSGNGVFPLFVTASVFCFFRLFQYGSLPSMLMPIPHVSKITEGRSISIILAYISVSTLIFWYFYSGAFRYFNLNLLKVYDFRDASAELSSVGFFAYFNGWVYKVFSIFLMSYFLLKRKFFHLIILLAIQLFFFGVSNHKAVIFYPFMVIGIWFYFRRSRAMSVIPLAFSFILGGCLIAYFSFDHVLAGSLFVRRVFFVPAKLTLDYFSFFSLNEFVFWSNSILSNFSAYPYSLSIPDLIGRFNGSDAAANNGFISSGYGHGGLLGVAIYTLIFSYFLRFLDVVVINSDVPVWLALCMTIVPLRAALVSSDLLTTMLTHGLALSLVMILLFRRSPSPSTKCSFTNV